MRHPGKPQTIAAFLAATVARQGEERALGFVRNGDLHWRTWREVFDAAARLAATMQEAGITAGDRVAQVSENRYEWIITDLALHLASAVHVPIHVTLSGEQIAAQIVDSGARLVFVSSHMLLGKFRSVLDGALPIVCHDVDSSTVPNCNAVCSGHGAKSRAVPSTDLATILYTSGTTGQPRGVMLSHDNLASNSAALAEAFGGGEDQLRLNILPLSHIYARTCDLYTWVYEGHRLVLAESRETLGRDCQLVRPTTLNAVPYVYQKIANNIRCAPGGEAMNGSKPVRESSAEKEADALRAFFGGRIETLCCGGAPLVPEIGKWFADRGLPILPGYGLTESSPVISASTPAEYRFGAVGRPLANVEVLIAEDGEILTRGPHVMCGYWQNEAATAEVIGDGWLHTGDFGQLDQDNYLSIRGRKKELIALSTGKKVHPARVESLLTASPLIEQAAVFGDDRPYLVALIVPTCREAGGQQLALTREELACEISHCLKSAAHEEQVRQFAIQERPFSIEFGEVTAKLSLCRSIIAARYGAQIAGLYCRQAVSDSSRARSV
jgi:long-chain acyl-CoA synthetase